MFLFGISTHQRRQPLARLLTLRHSQEIGGGGGIQTHGALRPAVFRTATIDHSDTPPNLHSARFKSGPPRVFHLSGVFMDSVIAEKWWRHSAIVPRFKACKAKMLNNELHHAPMKSRLEPREGFGPPTSCLQNSSATATPSRQIRTLVNHSPPTPRFWCSRPLDPSLVRCVFGRYRPRARPGSQNRRGGANATRR